MEKLMNLKFDPTNYVSIILLALVLLVSIFKAINSTFIEEVFMEPKKKEKNIFFNLVAVLVIFVPVNFILSMNHAFLIAELLCGMVGVVLYIVYNRKEVGTQKYAEGLDELNTYYKGKRSDCILLIIISIMPSFSIFLNTSTNSIPLFSCVVIVSVIEVLIIYLSIPELMKNESRIYFMNDERKVYVYKRIDKDTILCGDSPKINESNKYITISYEDLKEKVIFHVQYDNNLSKERKRELRNKYKKKQGKCRH